MDNTLEVRLEDELEALQYAIRHARKREADWSVGYTPFSAYVTLVWQRRADALENVLKRIKEGKHG